MNITENGQPNCINEVDKIGVKVESFVQQGGGGNEGMQLSRSEKQST